MKVHGEIYVKKKNYTMTVLNKIPSHCCFSEPIMQDSSLQANEKEKLPLPFPGTSTAHML